MHRLDPDRLDFQPGKEIEDHTLRYTHTLALACGIGDIAKYIANGGLALIQRLRTVNRPDGVSLIEKYSTQK